MDKQEALKMMAAGSKITHPHFTSDEYMQTGSSLDIEFEDGCQCTFEQFWQDRTGGSWDQGYSVFYHEGELPREDARRVDVKYMTNNRWLTVMNLWEGDRDHQDTCHRRITAAKPTARQIRRFKKQSKEFFRRGSRH